MRAAPHLRRLAVSLFAFASIAACGGQPHDQPADAGPPTALGSASRIAQVMNPASASHGVNNKSVSISGAQYLLVDSFDETHDGKSIGTVYMQDVPAPTPQPFSGVALYKPTYIPTNLVPAPGDVLDLVGTFSSSTSLGTATFDTGTSLIQLDDPILQPRFEYELPTPLVIQASDLNELNAPGGTLSPSAYDVGQQWVGMLVTIENITFPDGVSDSKGRDTIHLTSDTSEDAPTVDNELFDLATWNSSQTNPPLAAGKTVKSVTGIVTWFFNYHLAPRSPADIVVQ